MGSADLTSNSIIVTPNANKLLKNLKRIGVSPRDIDIDLQSKLQKDFKTFYSQYDERRDKDFEKTFPVIGEWYRGI